MPIEHKREGNACDKCKKLDTEVGKITYYTDPHDGYKGLLCSACITRREKSYTEKCPKCKRLAYKHGGLTYYDDSDVNESDMDDNSNGFNDFYDLSEEKPPSFSELMCLECHEKKVAKVKRNRKIKSTIKNFAKDHWKFWITIIVAIIGLIVGISRL